MYVAGGFEWGSSLSRSCKKIEKATSFRFTVLHSFHNTQLLTKEFNEKTR
jgi:hypothetical protein